MHLSLRIFRKDVERLWPAILLTLALLAYWMFQEATYTAVAMIDPQQGDWTNLTLPFAWAVLVALAVNQDPLTGDRQFWVALPSGWRPLLTAKTMFVVAFVHAPYFIATAVILASRGFNPAMHLPHLFWKQLVLLALVLPAFAAAALVKNLGQFVLLAITVASVFVLTSTRSNFALNNDLSWDVRGQVALAVLCSGAAAVILLQFLARRAIRSAAIGIAAVVAGLTLYTQLPRVTSAAIWTALKPANSVSLSIGLGSEAPDSRTQRSLYDFKRTTLLIPVELNGTPANTQARFDQIDLELISASGERYEAQWPDSANGVRRDALSANLRWGTAAQPWLFSWQVLDFYNAAAWNRVRSGKVTIHGHILARLERAGASVPVSSDRTELPGGELCSVADSGEYSEQRRMTVLTCESPEKPARETGVNWNFGGSPLRGAFLREHAFWGDSFFPGDPWLSPLHRGTASALGIITSKPVPAAIPHVQLGSTLIEYTMSDIDLNRFLVRDPGKAEAGK